VFKSAGGTLTQVHDLNPGEENELFWTTPIPTGAVRADFAAGVASMALHSFRIDDYGDVARALTGQPELATASISLQLNWSGLVRDVTYSNATLPTPFAAHEKQDVATMSWSAVENGVRFSGGVNTADFAVLAKERNGSFF
jgi:hypothetical protein